MAPANFAAQRTIHKNQSFESYESFANVQPDAMAANLNPFAAFCLRASAVLTSRYRDPQPRFTAIRRGVRIARGDFPSLIAFSR
jgi:hypothetical protein